MSYPKIEGGYIMSIKREEQIKDIFCAALEMAKDQRPEYLASACTGDGDMRREVESLLLSHEEANDFLEKPALKSAARLLKDGQQAIAERGNLSLGDNIIGERFDNKYLIETQLGQGGMGAVFKAIHLGTKRPVAIKVISPQFMANEQFVERFRREAEATGRLRHPNVVNVTDFGISNVRGTKLAYLVMEYLDGCTLGELLKRRGRLPLSLVVDIVEQVCLAIDEAHRQGIIHRDLKPENIWLEPDGRGGYNVKVLDFGLAKLRDNSGSSNKMTNLPPTAVNNSSNWYNWAGDISSGSTNTRISNPPADISAIQTFKANSDEIPTMEQHLTAGNIDPRTVPGWLTRVGMVLGTPLYMSPEQCHGKELDVRSDIYSLGVIVYEMLTGHPPFSGDFHQLIQKHTEMPPPSLKEYRRDVPKAVEQLIMSAMAKSQIHRPVSAKSFAVRLRACLEGEVPLLRQAFDFYRNNFSACLRVSFNMNLLFVVISGLTLTTLFNSQMTFPGAQFVQIGGWLFALLLFFIAGQFNAAAFSLIVEQLRSSQNRRVLVMPVLKEVGKQSKQIFGSVFRGYTTTVVKMVKLVLPGIKEHINNTLVAPVVVAEKVSVKQSIERSSLLSNGLRPLAASLQLRGASMAITTFMLCLIAYLLNNVLSDGLTMSYESRLVTGTAFILLVPGTFIALISPLFAISTALFYFKAREANGETLITTIGNNYQEFENYQRVRSGFTRKALAAAAMITMILFSSFSYLLIVPPVGVIPRVSQKPFVRVPADQNAWSEYSLALQDVIDWNSIPVQMNGAYDSKRWNEVIGERIIAISKNDVYSTLENTASGKGPFDEKQLAYLDSHANTIKHILAGAKLPKAQFQNEPLTMDSPLPNLLQCRAVIQIANAQARRLILEGKQQEAAELYLAAYRMAADMAEPGGSLIGVLIAVVCHGMTAQSLFYSINSGDFDADTLIMIAQRLAEIETRAISPVQAINSEWDASLLTTEKILVDGKKLPSALNTYSEDPNAIHPANVIRYFPGLRMRLFNRIVQFRAEQDAVLLPGLEKWQFNELRGKQEEFLVSKAHWTNYINPVVALGNMIASIGGANGLAMMKSLYMERNLSASLQSFAACSAYQKKHGKLPETLTMAMSEIGLSVPIDQATGKEVRYRVENGKAVIWFAGIDGKDDGGTLCYKQEDRASFVPGSDFIFKLGETPFIFVNKMGK